MWELGIKEGCNSSISYSVMSDSVTVWTVTHQAALSTGFSQQEYWSGLPFPSPEDLPNPGIKPGSSRHCRQILYCLSYREAMKKRWFLIVMLEKTLESPLDYKDKKLVNPKKKNNPEYSLDGLMLKVKFQYSGHLMWRVDSSEKNLMLGKIEGRRSKGSQKMRRSKGSQKMRRLDSITNTMDWVSAKSRREWRTRKPGVLQSMGSQRMGHDLAPEQQWRQDTVYDSLCYTEILVAFPFCV